MAEESEDQGLARSVELQQMWRNFGAKNPSDSRVVLQAVVDEARINAAEVNLLRQQVSNCYFENGVNHLEEW
ncbi:hypothetical protein BASA81_005378 [Batrachochytrium salamandrivorans]|nr:hypothetical protein BASA81_005378 [Batrachochytrium salamandrivorans]